MPCLENSKEGMLALTLLDWKPLSVLCVQSGLVLVARVGPAGVGDQESSMERSDAEVENLAALEAETCPCSQTMA